MYDVLAGVKVIEVASWVFVPTAGVVLAEWGAEVVKIEHPVTGDPVRGLQNALAAFEGTMRTMLEVTNRGKQSVAIDISVSEGRELLYRLVRDADVFTTNYLPAVRANLGIDVDDIRAQNPRIIYARGTGQGVRGAEAERGAFDLATSWARSGMAHAMTTDGSAPPFQPSSVGDLSSGLTLAGAIAAALFRRERTGQGAVVDASLYATGMWLMGPAIAGAPFGRIVPLTDRNTTFNPLVNYFPTKDDRWICLVLLQAERWWPDMARHLGRADLAEDPRFATSETRREHHEELVATLDEVFSARTLAEWREVLATTEGVWAPVLTASEVSEDPQALDNGYLPEVVLGDGSTYRIVPAPIQFDGEPVGPLRRAPEHGEQTEEAILGVGAEWQEIVELKDRSVIL